MIWNAWSDFWEMGGYGGYVWGSFGVTALVLVLELVMLSLRRQALKRQSSDAQMEAHETST
jgi:heme exporter protein D